MNCAITIQPSGEVLLSRWSGADEADPVLGSFLSYLSKSIANQPEHIKQIDTDFVRRIQDVINGWTVFAHLSFIAQLELLNVQVEALRQKILLDTQKRMQPSDWQQSVNWRLVLSRKLI